MELSKYVFVAWCIFGKGDSGETEVEVELTDEESKRLISYGTKADIYYDGFSNCKELRDVYVKIYSLAVDQMTEEMRYGDLYKEELNDPNWKVNDTFACGVEFPREFEDMLIEDEE